MPPEPMNFQRYQELLNGRRMTENKLHDNPKVSFKWGNDSLIEFEALQRDYRGDIVVEFGDGRQFDIVVFTPLRIAQDLDRTTEFDQPYFAEPAMIVLPEITTPNIERAVKRLAEDGFFDRLVPHHQSEPPTQSEK